jgi:hypothetical protein
MCHRYTSANSFSKNVFKIIGGLDWERKMMSLQETSAVIGSW